MVVSGRGSNLMALQGQAARLGYEITGVVCNNENAPALSYAQSEGLAVAIVDHRHYAHSTLFETALAAAIDAFKPDLIALAGFMRILGPAFVHHYLTRLINIHPSLLPAFPGLDTHRRALEAGEREHGATVHFVTDALDGGPIIAQERLAIVPGEDPSKLAARVLTLEHRLYPEVLGRFARGEIHYPHSPEIS